MTDGMSERDAKTIASAARNIDSLPRIMMHVECAIHACRAGATLGLGDALNPTHQTLQEIHTRLMVMTIEEAVDVK